MRVKLKKGRKELREGEGRGSVDCLVSAKAERSRGYREKKLLRYRSTWLIVRVIPGMRPQRGRTRVHIYRREETRVTR